MRINIIIAAAALACASAANASAQRIEAAGLGPLWDAAISPGGKHLATGCRAGEDQAICLYDLEAFEATAALPGPDGASLASLFWASDDILVYTIEMMQRFNTIDGIEEFKVERPAAFDTRTRENTILLRGRRDIISGVTIASLLRDEPDVLAVELTMGSDDRPETGTRLVREPDARSVLQRVDLVSGGVGRIFESSLAATSQIATDPFGEVYAHVRNQDDGDYEIISVDGRDQRTILEGRREGPTGIAYVYGRIPQADALGVHLPDQGVRRLDLATGDVSAFEVSGQPIVDSFRAELVGFDLQSVLPRQVFLDAELASTQAALTNALGARSVTLHAWSDDRQVMLVAAHDAGEPAFYLFDAAAGQLSGFEP